MELDEELVAIFFAELFANCGEGHIFPDIWEPFCVLMCLFNV